MIKKAHFILKASDIKPTIGGTIKKPRYPIVEMEVNAEPLLKLFDLPAMLNTNGTVQETPIPINTKPKIVGIINGKRKQIKNPTLIITAL